MSIAAYVARLLPEHYRDNGNDAEQSARLNRLKRIY